MKTLVLLFTILATPAFACEEICKRETFVLTAKVEGSPVDTYECIYRGPPKSEKCATSMGYKDDPMSFTGVRHEYSGMLKGTTWLIVDKDIGCPKKIER